MMESTKCPLYRSSQNSKLKLKHRNYLQNPQKSIGSSYMSHAD